MSTGLRIAVIGGGVLGLSTALAASELGAHVTVLEADTLASGSSGLSAGHIGTQFVDPDARELRIQGLSRFTELERECNVPIVRIGYMRVTRNRDDLNGFLDAAEAQRAAGIDGVAVLTPREIRDRIPHLALDDVAGALFGANDGYTDGHILCSAYAEKAGALGAEILQRTPAVGYEKRFDGSHRIETPRGPIDADVIVNAGGAWAERVGELLGAPVPIVSQRHQTCLAKPARPLGYVMPITMDYVASERDSGLYFRQEGADQLLVGMHTEDLSALPAEPDPDRYRRVVSPEFVEDVAARLTRQLPSLQDMGLVAGWAGLYPNSRDGWPIVGPDGGDDSVIAAAGGGSSGIQLSPIIGQLAAEWALHRVPRSLAGAERYVPSRFAAKGSNSHVIHTTSAQIHQHDAHT